MGNKDKTRDGDVTTAEETTVIAEPTETIAGTGKQPGTLR